MKRKELLDLRKEDPGKLKKMVVEKKLELMRFIVNSKASSEKNLKKGKNLKREIAQILTLVHEREFAEKEKNLSKK